MFDKGLCANISAGSFNKITQCYIIRGSCPFPQVGERADKTTFSNFNTPFNNCKGINHRIPAYFCTVAYEGRIGIHYTDTATHKLLINALLHNRVGPG